MITPGKIGKRKRLSESLRLRRISNETGHPIGVHRIIDRRSDHYYERVVDQVTGEELRHVSEPLSKHIGRGDAKKRDS